PIGVLLACLGIDAGLDVDIVDHMPSRFTGHAGACGTRRGRAYDERSEKTRSQSTVPCHCRLLLVSFRRLAFWLNQEPGPGARQERGVTVKQKTPAAPVSSMLMWETRETFVRSQIQNTMQAVQEEELSTFLGRGKPRRPALSCGTIEMRRPRARNLEERFARAEYGAWGSHDLSDRELVYVWADGVYVKAGLDKEGGKRCGCNPVRRPKSGTPSLGHQPGKVGPQTATFGSAPWSVCEPRNSLRIWDDRVL
ncbi:MAG: hypothetical protein ABIR79_07660, partial [Candidatus Binatia bacterium]